MADDYFDQEFRYGRYMSDMYGPEDFDYGEYDEWIYFEDVILERETQKAWLCSSSEWTGKEWFPKSRCYLKEEKGGCKLSVPGWLAKEKNIIEEEDRDPR